MGLANEPYGLMLVMAKTRAKRVKLLLFDVDGVLTDGKLFFFPAIGAQSQQIAERAAGHEGQSGYGIQSTTILEVKGFHAHDGIGVSLAKLGGLKTGLITKRISETVALRAKDLKLDYCEQGILDKLSTFRKILRREGISEGEAAFVGDDVIDLAVMRHCGLAIAVANAREEVKDEAHFITDHRGGEGALRDAVEYILRAQGKLDGVLKQYISGKRG